MPLVVPANQRASVCACVQKNPQFAVAAADEEKRPPRYVPTPVVTRVLDFGFVAQIQPAFIENPLLLHPKNFDRRHGGAMNSKYALFRIVYDQIFRVENRASLVDFIESRTLGPKQSLLLFYGAVSWQGRFGSLRALALLRETFRRPRVPFMCSLLHVRREQLVRTDDAGRETLFVNILADRLQRRPIRLPPLRPKIFFQPFPGRP